MGLRACEGYRKRTPISVEAVVFVTSKRYEALLGAYERQNRRVLGLGAALERLQRVRAEELAAFSGVPAGQGANHSLSRPLRDDLPTVYLDPGRSYVFCERRGALNVVVRGG